MGGPSGAEHQFTWPWICEYLVDLFSLGYLTAQYNVAVNFFAGMGVKHDFKTAAYYFDLAARRGHVLAKV